MFLRWSQNMEDTYKMGTAMSLRGQTPFERQFLFSFFFTAFVGSKILSKMNDKMSIRSPTDPFVESLEGTTSLRLCINKLGITEQEVRQEYDKFAREYDKVKI